MSSKPPAAAGRIVSMIEHAGSVYVACEFGVFVLNDGEFKQVIFVNSEHGIATDYDAAVSRQTDKPKPLKPRLVP